MNPDISEGARTVMDGLWGYVSAAVVAPLFVVLSMLRFVKGDYTWREKLAFCRPGIFVVWLVIVVLFLGSQLNDVMIVAKGPPHALGFVWLNRIANGEM